MSIEALVDENITPEGFDSWVQAVSEAVDDTLPQGESPLVLGAILPYTEATAASATRPTVPDKARLIWLNTDGDTPAANAATGDLLLLMHSED